jgi:hypothetical protein
MGAGAGVEVKHLLDQDWTVHAEDNEESSLNFIKKSIGKCKLIFGSASFTFCHPKHLKLKISNFLRNHI